MSTITPDILVDGFGMLDGYAAVRGQRDESVAIFLCPGKGTGAHCFRTAINAAKDARFFPCSSLSATEMAAAVAE